MLPKRFHDDNESIVALKGSTSIKIEKTSENVGAWNGTGGFWKHWSRENIGVWKDVRRLWETSECRIGKRQSMENVGKCQTETSETSECEIRMEIWGRV